MKKNKPAKQEWRDDGRVIADMSVDGMNRSGLSSMRRRRKDAFGEVATKQEPLMLTRQERRAIIRGVITAHVGVILAMLALFAIVFLLISVWLS